MHHAVGERIQPHKSPEVGDFHHLALQCLADPEIMGYLLDYFFRFFCRVTLAGQVDRPVVVNGYLGAGFFHYILNGFPAPADNQANFIRIDFDNQYRRRIGRNVWTRFWNFFFNFIYDADTGLFGLFHCLVEYFYRHAFNFHIQLDGCHAFPGTGDFEIHIAVVIFRSLDIGQNFIFMVGFIHEPHSDTGNWRLNRHSAVHQGKRRSANRGLGSGAVGSHRFGNNAHRVRKFRHRRQHHRQRFFYQRAVPNLSAIGKSVPAHFARRVRRKIIMMHESFLFFYLESIDCIPRLRPPERKHRKHVRASAVKNSRTVKLSGNSSGLRVQIAKLVHFSAISALIFFYRFFMQDIVLSIIE